MPQNKHHIIQTDEEKLVFLRNRNRLLKKKLQRYKSLAKKNMNDVFGMFTDVVAIFDRNGEFLTLFPENPKKEYKPVQEMLGKNVLEVLPKEIGEKFRYGITETLSNNVNQSFDYKLTVSGEEMWFEAKLSPFGKNKVLFVGRDITHRKLAEEELNKQLITISIQQIEIEKTNAELHTALEELQATTEELYAINDEVYNANNLLKTTNEKLSESEEKFKNIISQTIDGIFVTNHYGKIIEWNHAMETITSLSFEEASTLYYWDIEIILNIEKQENKHQIIKKIQNFWKQDTNLYKQNIQSIVNNNRIDLSVFKIYSNSGDMLGGIVKDITKIYETQSQNELLAAIVDNTEDFASIKNLDLEIMSMNKSLLKALGLNNIAEVKGKTDKELFGYQQNELYSEYMTDETNAQKLKAGEGIEKEEIFEYPDGKKIVTIVKKFPVFNDEKKLVGTANISRNITKIKETENALRESESSLKDLNKTKDKLLSIIAHDLKNPFSSIIGMTEFIQMKNKDMALEKLLYYNNLIHQSAQQGYGLLENLLQWALAQSGKLQSVPQNFQLVYIVREATEMLVQTAKAKNITIENQINEDLIANADINLCKVVIRNITGNAVKFTPQEGKIWISANQEMINNKLMITLKISDNGVGIPKEILEKLFLTGENISRKGTENESGTGLGLLLCKEFTDKIQGNLRVESIENKGTTFYFSIPNGI